MAEQPSHVTETRQCPRCQAWFKSDRLGGLCPRCVLQKLLETDSRPPPAEGPAAIRVFGDYELLEETGRGGMGVVYRARQLSLNRTVAVKMMLAGHFAGPEAIQRFRLEAESAARLQHPNIVAIHEIGEEEGQAYFSMDFIDGQSLADRVRDQPLPPREAARYLQILAEAVSFAHQHGVVHRDLKPANVLIDSFDQPRITDFGLAKHMQVETELTRSGQCLGSPQYLPPERAQGRWDAVGPRSDLYSLGAILYHLLTGRPPQAGATVAQTLALVLHADVVRPRVLNPGIPRDLETICLKCLEKNPGRRYGTGRELADELGRFLRGEPILARPISRAEKFWRWCRRHPAQTVTTLSALLILGAGLGGI